MANVVTGNGTSRGFDVKLGELFPKSKQNGATAEGLEAIQSIVEELRRMPIGQREPRFEAWAATQPPLDMGALFFLGEFAPDPISQLAGKLLFGGLTNGGGRITHLPIPDLSDPTDLVGLAMI